MTVSIFSTDFMPPCLRFRGKERIRMMQSIAGIWAAMLALWSHQSPMLQDAYYAAIGAIMVDTVTGVIKAGAMGRIRSRSLTRGFLAKMMIFASVTAVVLFFSVLTHQANLMLVPAYVVLSMESVSIIENIYFWEKYGGQSLPSPVRAVLNAILSRLGKYLEVSAQMIEDKPLIVKPEETVRNTEK